MRIAFLLPVRSRVPIGGFKIVYEYANLLVDRGHEVSVLHPRTYAAPKSPQARLRSDLWVRWHRLRPGRMVPWLAIDPRVGLRPISHVSEAEVPPADAIVATTWQTAQCVAAVSPAKGKGFYLIQGHETAWDPAEEAAWRLPLYKIVIARWLEEIATEIGEGDRTSRVPVGLDLEQWGVDVEPGERPDRVGFLLGSGKGQEEILSALPAVRARIPGLAAAGFGTEARPADLPEWVEYTRLPAAAALRRLYNSCAVFLQASRAEGWGLPAVESMACGCALVTYDNGGSREYAKDRETALVVAHGPESLAAGVIELLADADLRLSLSRQGGDLAREFDWTRSVAAFERILTREVSAEPG